MFIVSSSFCVNLMVWSYWVLGSPIVIRLGYIQLRFVTFNHQVFLCSSRCFLWLNLLSVMFSVVVLVLSNTVFALGLICLWQLMECCLTGFIVQICRSHSMNFSCYYFSSSPAAFYSSSKLIHSSWFFTEQLSLQMISMHTSKQPLRIT